MTTVVTGAAGFVGQHLVAALAARGERVVGVDRLPAPPGAPVTVWLATDVADGHDDLRDVLQHADAVVHLAGRPGVRDAAPDVERGRWRDNVLAGEVVLQATPAATTTVVVSSSSVYGGARRTRTGWAPCHEDQPLAPRGGYARSKAALEDRCADRRAAGGHVAVARPFTVAGEGQRPDMALATWARQARAGSPMTVLGSPTRRRDVTDVRDVVAGLLALLDRGPAATVNLGTGRTHSLDELTAAVARALGVERRLELHDADVVEVPATRADTRRCRRLLGLLPTTDLDELVMRQLVAPSPLPSPIPEPA